MRHFRHLLSLGAALVVGGAMVGVTATPAQADTGHYVATPAQAPTKSKIITRETLWKLNGATYVAAKSSERDAFLCGAVARDAGALASFTVAGKAFDADQLAACNAKAKGGVAGAAVAQAR